MTTRELGEERAPAVAKQPNGTQETQMIGDHKLTARWELIETLNGWVVTSFSNDVQLGAPCSFDTETQARGWIELDRQRWADVQKQVQRQWAQL